MHSIPNQTDGENEEEQALVISDNVNDQTPLINMVDSEIGRAHV